MKHFKKCRIVLIYQRQLDGGHIGPRGKKFRTPTEGENHFSWIVMLKSKKDKFGSFISSGTRDIVFFVFSRWLTVAVHLG